jgi:DNA-binding FadR family transcriptional regulator
LRLLKTEWGEECVALVQDFFSAVMEAIRSGDNDAARRLLRTLREPNETHLGLSVAKSRGRALGHESAGDVWQALR